MKKKKQKSRLTYRQFMKQIQSTADKERLDFGTYVLENPLLRVLPRRLVWSTWDTEIYDN